MVNWKMQQDFFPGMEKPDAETPDRKKARKKTNGYEPPYLGKAIRLPVPDFSDPDRPPVCLEVDFPIAPINALSNLEGNAGKPIIPAIRRQVLPSTDNSKFLSAIAPSLF
jgi:hypothetical protein